MDKLLAGFPEKLGRFFAGIPPKYPLCRGFKICRRFITGDAMISSPPGIMSVGIPYWDVGEIG